MESYLENTINSYQILIRLIIFFFVLLLLLMLVNSKGMNKMFGYQMTITGPLLVLLSVLIKDIIIFRRNPDKSWLSSLSMSKNPMFIYIIISIAFALAMLNIVVILTVNGLFEDKDNPMNVPVLVNLIIVTFFIIIALTIYNNYKEKDNISMSSFSGYLKDVYHLRTKYTLIFVLFVLVMSVLYFLNPYGIMTKYGGPAVFFTLFIGMLFVIMITIYQVYLSDSKSSSNSNSIPSFLLLFGKGIYILSALGISIALIYALMKFMGIFNQDASKPETWGYIFFNLFLFSLMIGIIYKLVNVGGFLSKNPIFKLIINTILYIPCLLVSLFEKIKTQSKSPNASISAPKTSDLKILGISVLLLGGYFTWLILGKPIIQKTFLKQGGKQIVNQPIPTNKLNNISSYQQLTGSDKFDYRYCLSFWFYLDSFPPSTSSAYNKPISILSYGGNPNIQYNSTDNSLYITIKQNSTDTSKKELKLEDIYEWKNVKESISDAIENVKRLKMSYDNDVSGNRIIYVNKNVLLQKWNHVLLNYSGGTLDVFYNGQLVKSSIEVVPYMNFDMLTVGEDNGVSGNVANVLYYKKPLDIYTIHTLYNSLKDSNPPVIPNNNETIVSI